MLEFLSAIAGLMGFGIQVADKIRDASKADAGLVLYALWALSKSSKSWKALHTRYHPLNVLFQSVVGEISTYNGGAHLPKDPGDVAPNELRKRFFDPTVSMVLENFRRETSDDIVVIQRSFNRQDAKYLDNVSTISRIDSGLGDDFAKLASTRDEALEKHAEFLAFLAQVSAFKAEPRWDLRRVEFILSNRIVLTNLLPRMIDLTDKILMTLLDTYIRIVVEYEHLNKVRL
jgi:hypothetical protein